MPIESVEGLVQALPETERESAQAFLAQHIAAAVEPLKRQHDAANAELRKARGSVSEYERARAAWEADLANARSAAEQAAAEAKAAAAYKAKLDEVLPAYERAQQRAAKYDRTRWEQHVMEAGELGRVEDAHYLVDHLGLAPQFDEADVPVLDEAASKRLKAFLDKPENRERYVRGGRRVYQQPGPPDPNRPPAAYIPPALANADPATQAYIAKVTGLRAPR